MLVLVLNTKTEEEKGEKCGDDNALSLCLYTSVSLPSGNRVVLRNLFTGRKSRNSVEVVGIFLCRFLCGLFLARFAS